MVWRTPVVFLGVLSILICVISLECDGYMPDGREHVSSREILKFPKEIRNVFCTQVRFPEDVVLQIIPVPSLNLICLCGLVWNLG